MIKEGLFYSTEKDNSVCCGLCPQSCIIADDCFGFCRVRSNKNGKLILPFYGSVSALAIDPIEKKPLYHFLPGTEIFSAGFTGCNFRCPFCQNWHISQDAQITHSSLKQMLPQELVSAAMRIKSVSIAYTYSEPLVHAEYLLDCMALARKNGIANVLVTNGCINSNAAQKILSLTDAVNIDLKCFSRKTYTQILGGKGGDAAGNFMETVLDFITLAVSKKVHVEITTLIVPGINDNEAELESCADFISSINVPWHLSAYHPNHKWKAPATDPMFLKQIKSKAEKKISYVYTGNIFDESNNTLCNYCSSVLIQRTGYKTCIDGLVKADEDQKYYHCKKCGQLTNIRFGIIL